MDNDILQPVKSANQLYNESGTSLAFKDWLIREKIKGTFMKNDTLTEIVEQAKTDTGVNTVTVTDRSKFLGINKKVLLASAIIVGVALTIRYYQKK